MVARGRSRSSVACLVHEGDGGCGMSSQRSRRGGQAYSGPGSWVGEIASRTPSSPDLFRLVAGTERTSAAVDRVPPTHSNSRSCGTRSGLAWKASEIRRSSRKEGALVRYLEAPLRSPARAGELPFSWPSSDSSRTLREGRAVHHLTKGHPCAATRVVCGQSPPCRFRSHRAAA